jgi:hypothetical protein
MEPHGFGTGVGVDAGAGLAATTTAARNAIIECIVGRGAVPRQPPNGRIRYPNGSSVRRLALSRAGSYRNGVMLELSLVLLTVVCFTILDRYVYGCEKI